MPVDDRRQSSKNTVDSELIGIVYEAAFDPYFWPDLLEGISQLFNDRRSDRLQTSTLAEADLQQIRLFSDQLSKGEAQRLAILLPHLYRALKLKREYNDADHSRGQAQAIIEQFPFGVLLVNARGKLISANQHALDTIADSNMLYLENDALCSTAKDQNQQLKEMISKAANTPLDAAGEHVSSIKINGEDGASFALLITPDPYPNIPYDQQAENCAAIFIGSASLRQHVSMSALQTLFGLTQAEARLTSLLASGESLSQAAEQSYISKNTAKVQLKSIFTKVGVSRQAELIKRIFTSPAVFEPVDVVSEEGRLKAETKWHTHINGEGHLILGDGRRLQYAEYGDPQGLPVVHIHGVLGCRYERLPDDGLTSGLGVRLIIPDRPGYGLSDPAPGCGYLDFADDLLQLLDHLDIPQCSIVGLSVGAIYGSAFAYQSPARLRSLAMVSTTPPFRSFADFTGVPASLKLLIAFSKYLPSAAQMITEIAISNACKNPGKFLANIPSCAADQAVFHHTLLQGHIEQCLLTGSKDCHVGFVNDILLSAQPWPFAVDGIQTTVNFWHGTEDQHSPISRIQPVIDAIANKCFHRIKGGGHFLIYEHWQKILGSLIH